MDSRWILWFLWLCRPRASARLCPLSLPGWIAQPLVRLMHFSCKSVDLHMLAALRPLSAGAMPIAFECLHHWFQSERHYAKGTVNRMVRFPVIPAIFKNWTYIRILERQRSITTGVESATLSCSKLSGVNLQSCFVTPSLKKKKGGIENLPKSQIRVRWVWSIMWNFERTGKLRTQ